VSATTSAKPGTGKRSVLSGDFPIRLLSASVLIAIGLLGVYFGGIWAGIIAGTVAFIINLEWAAMSEGVIYRTLGFAIVVVVAVLLASLGHLALGLILVAAAIVAAAAFNGDVWMPAGIAYSACFGLSLMALRTSPDYGARAIIVLFAVVWATDTGAYLAGRLIGGPKLWPAVSPAKTWAGAVGGLVAAVIVALIAARLLDGVPVTPALTLIIVALSLACQGGDLFESAMKRRFGIKDASHIIPGHGGMMDRMDGLTFSGVLAALIGWLHGGGDAIARGLLQW
jgi:phosphatidate cytidylyltransferase